MRENREAEAGLPGDPALFKALTEMSMIASLADRAFERAMPGRLTVAQFGVLNRLLRIEGEETVGELAAAFQVAQPTMSSTVKKLLDKGYVSFTPDTEDRRVKRVTVTKAGRDIRMAAVQAIGPGVAALEEATGGTDWEGLLPVLKRLRVFLDNTRTGPV
ncbi:MarR family winged helix-turn-helix transcriptional regulator [Hyphococcus sp.]|uniref:MarR family winged helix-turn-helix transcriptional regulator n=1 Tax=Hyphococcus sp. TaxID=2038636 RepID=UPI003D0D10E7